MSLTDLVYPSSAESMGGAVFEEGCAHGSCKDIEIGNGHDGSCHVGRAVLSRRCRFCLGRIGKFDSALDLLERVSQTTPTRDTMIYDTLRYTGFRTAVASRGVLGKCIRDSSLGGIWALHHLQHVHVAEDGTGRFGPQFTTQRRPAQTPKTLSGKNREQRARSPGQSCLN